MKQVYDRRILIVSLEAFTKTVVIYCSNPVGTIFHIPLYTVYILSNFYD